MREKLEKDELDLEVYTRIKRAEQRFNGQFFTKAAKKEAMGDLNFAYYLLRREAFANFADTVIGMRLLSLSSFERFTIVRMFLQSRKLSKAKVAGQSDLLNTGATASFADASTSWTSVTTQ